MHCEIVKVKVSLVITGLSFLWCRFCMSNLTLSMLWRFTGRELSCCIYSRRFYYQSSLSLSDSVCFCLFLGTIGRRVLTDLRSLGWYCSISEMYFGAKLFNDLWTVAVLLNQFFDRVVWCAEQLLFWMSSSWELSEKPEKSPLKSYNILGIKAWISLLNLIHFSVVIGWLLYWLLFLKSHFWIRDYIRCHFSPFCFLTNLIISVLVSFN